MSQTIVVNAVEAPSKARAALLKRLADIVCLPEGRVNAFERAVAVDLLADALETAVQDERRRLAVRLATVAAPPSALARPLLKDHIEVAAPLLEACPQLDQADLIHGARHGGPEHRRLIAVRRGVEEALADALTEFGEPAVFDLLMGNPNARLGQGALATLVGAAWEEPALINGLLDRPELTPRQAYALFWPASSEARRRILLRFAVSRDLLRDAVQDIFAVASAEGWRDPLSRKALQFIGRRQRNREAQSPFSDLESAVAAVARGLSPELSEEIVRLAGVGPATGRRILNDAGGEPLAVMCKAAGLSRDDLAELSASQGRDAAAAESLLILFDTLAVDRAQTVLRYWDTLS